MAAENSFLGIFRAFKYFHELGYISETDMIAGTGKILHDRHSEIIEQLIRHGNLTPLKEAHESIRKSKKKSPVENYITVFFPVKIEDNNIKIDRSRNMKEFSLYDTKNTLPFETFLTIRKVLRRVKREDILMIMNSYHQAENWIKRLEKYIQWPSTDAPEAVKKIFAVGFTPEGILSHEGYHVGELSSPARERRKILDSIMVEDFSHLSEELDDEYISEWGKPLSLMRLMKLANTIAALCRNAKRSPNNFAKAIEEWESDLAYLKKKYYMHGFEDTGMQYWPSTSPMFSDDLK